MPVMKGHQARVVLSEELIPAVPGEFYSYPHRFDAEHPLYVLCKCKANKARIIAEAKELGSEANLMFLFGADDGPQICAIGTAHEAGLLGDNVNGDAFGETWIAPADVSLDEFERIRTTQDVERLVEICETACATREVIETLEPDKILAVQTNAGKYGLFRVVDTTPNSIQIEACHILVQ